MLELRNFIVLNKLYLHVEFDDTAGRNKSCQLNFKAKGVSGAVSADLITS